MAFCPNCRSEYRKEFTTCKACGGIALVDRLPDEADAESLQLSEAELAEGQPVGFTQGGSGREVSVDGRKIDPARIFVLATAAQVRDVLAEAGIASGIAPLDVDLADGVPRFEVRVRADAQARAEQVLFDRWRESMGDEGVEGAGDVALDQCPACGAKVPLDVEECPDCGLVVGTGEDRAAAAAEE
jgi:hypothetical protein